ncbi:MAG: GBS Bsp-like repeat-containing protein, partial [Eubacterium sp.]
GGQDDIIWYTASKTSNDTYELMVDIKNHGYDTGFYAVHAYGTDNNGKQLLLGTTSTTVPQMTAKSVTASEVKDGKFKVTVSGINAPLGIRDIMIPVWSDHGGQDDIIWYTASKTSNDTYELTVDIKNHGYDTGEYIAHVYGTDNNGIQICIGTTSVMVEYNANIIPSIPFTKDTTIMGSTFVTASKLADYYNSKATYPQYYIDRGVTLEQFTQMYIDESNAEGVRAEVAFAQMLHETGYLKFGGDVKIGQFNFAGLGATGGVPGNTFVDYGDNATGIRMGIRAQVQHLKCYGSNEALNNPCVDPRWGDWIRLKATTVGKLAGTWAADKTYGDKLVAIMNSF